MSIQTINIKKGIESLRASVLEDCKKGDNCFNPNGCNVQRTKMVPEENPKLIAMGFTMVCKQVSKCTHAYCDKYKWVLDRAQMYAELTGKTQEEVLAAWEQGRSYWYMNYYQDAHQPEIKKAGIRVVKFEDWINELKNRFGENANEWKFKCPSCGGFQSINDFIEHNIENPDAKVYYSCIGRYVKGRGFDWTLGGLLQIHHTVVVKDLQLIPVFEIAEKEVQSCTK